MKIRILKTNEAAANNCGAMESGAHFKNGRGLKSQKILLSLVFLSMSVLYSSCFLIKSTTRIIDYTAISSKNHTLTFDRTMGVQVVGESRGFGNLHIKDAISNALLSAGPEYDLLVDGMIFEIYFKEGFSGTRVTGTAVNSAKQISILGEEEFEKWYAEHAGYKFINLPLVEVEK